MKEEIVNRVAKSPLVTMDLEALYPRGPRHVIDLSQWLEEGLILREKAFREALKGHEWNTYANGYVSIHCSTDAIVPAWAYMLVASYLAGLAKDIVVGSPELLETVLFSRVLQRMDLAPFRDRPVIIKGCSELPVPPSAYVWALQKVQEVAKSVMYGEACAAVPLFKK